MYQAVVCKLGSVSPIEKADRISTARVAGCTVVVGRDHQEGDVGVFFECDGALTDEFCTAMDLYSRTETLPNGDVVRAGGFIDRRNRRVRAQTFRGARSEGFWMPLESLARWDHIAKAVDSLKVGEEFSSLNGKEICYKYVAQATQSAMVHKQKQLPCRKKLKSFPEHVDTVQFDRDLHRALTPGSLITVSSKLHGTSARYGFVETPVVEKGWFRRFVLWITNLLCTWLGIFGTRYEYVRGTRHTVQDDNKDKKNSYYAKTESGEKFREVVFNRFKDRLRPNEVVYGEIVGWVGPQTLVMPAPSIDKIQDKKVRKELMEKYGNGPPIYPEGFDVEKFKGRMCFTYGCKPGDCRFYVYRITNVDREGNLIELSDLQMRARAEELGVHSVPWMVRFIVPEAPSEEQIREMAKKIEELAEQTHNSPGGTNISEGVVVRTETPTGKTLFFKKKNFWFKILEDLAKEENLEDREESA